jgi:hypothetical protein
MMAVKWRSKNRLFFYQLVQANIQTTAKRFFAIRDFIGVPLGIYTNLETIFYVGGFAVTVESKKE